MVGVDVQVLPIALVVVSIIEDVAKILTVVIESILVDSGLDGNLKDKKVVSFRGMILTSSVE